MGRPPRTDLLGRRFGRLIALEYIIGKRWRCRCDCGNELTVMTCHLRRGDTNSCGCLQKELLSKRRKTHGHSHGTAEYAAWHHMKQRCEDVNHPAYKNYGARGITVCERWRKDFTAFLADMGLKPHPRLTLERVNNEKGYSPENCTWATYYQQIHNRRVSKS